MTQRVSFDDVEDLLARRARAALAYAACGGPQCVPVVVRRDDGMIGVGLYPNALLTSGAPEQVVLVIDDGAYWFELRAAVWRGTVASASEDGGGGPGDDGLVWLRLEPNRFAAWDYARLREDPAQ